MVVIKIGKDAQGTQLIGNEFHVSESTTILEDKGKGTKFKGNKIKQILKKAQNSKFAFITVALLIMGTIIGTIELFQ